MSVDLHGDTIKQCAGDVRKLEHTIMSAEDMVKALKPLSAATLVMSLVYIYYKSIIVPLYPQQLELILSLLNGAVYNLGSRGLLQY